MKDMIKRSIPLIIVLSITLAGAGVLGYMFLSSQGKVANQHDELAKIKKEKTAIKQFDIKLDGPNVRQAEENATVAWQKYEEAMAELNAKYEKAVLSNELGGKDPTEAKLFVRGWCDTKRELLEQSARTKCMPGLEYFTFGGVADVPTLPPAKDVPSILYNVVIVDEVIAILAESGFASLDELSRGDKLELLDHEGDFKYKPFKMKATGDYAAIRTFVNRIQDARYLFIIRKLSLNAEDLTKILGPVDAESGRQPGRPSRGGVAPVELPAKPRGKSKDSRIAFAKMAKVTLDIEFDYMELTEHKKQGGK